MSKYISMTMLSYCFDIIIYDYHKGGENGCRKNMIAMPYKGLCLCVCVVLFFCERMCVRKLNIKIQESI